MAKNQGSGSSGPSNVPGLEYLLRVGKAWQDAMTGQVDAVQTAWNEIKAGNYDHKTMGRLWADAVESYYDTLVEATRGPGYVNRPAWMYFTHKQSDPQPLERIARIDRTEALNTVLEMTDFASLQGLGALSQAKLYEECAFTKSRREINIRLDVNEIVNGRPDKGQYMSFVFGKDRGAEPPLVIVMLRIDP